MASENDSGYTALAAAIVLQAIRDLKYDKDSIVAADALTWLLGEGFYLAGALGLEPSRRDWEAWVRAGCPGRDRKNYTRRPAGDNQTNGENTMDKQTIAKMFQSHLVHLSGSPSQQQAIRDQVHRDLTTFLAAQPESWREPQGGLIYTEFCARRDLANAYASEADLGWLVERGLEISDALTITAHLDRLAFAHFLASGEIPDGAVKNG
jgi:hypothetical protein